MIRPRDARKLYLTVGDQAKAIGMLKSWCSPTSRPTTPTSSSRRSSWRHGFAGRDDAMERAVFINPFPAELHRSLAELAEARRDKCGTCASAKRSWRSDPVDKADALYRLALAYRAAGDVRRPSGRYYRALEDAPNFERARTCCSPS